MESFNQSFSSSNIVNEDLQVNKHFIKENKENLLLPEAQANVESISKFTTEESIKTNKPETKTQRSKNLSKKPNDLPTLKYTTNHENVNNLISMEKFKAPTSEKLLPVMNVISSFKPASPTKERTISIYRTQSVDSENSKMRLENSKVFSSQESLQSPKHTDKNIQRASKTSSILSPRESFSSSARRFSGGSTVTVAPKSTSTSSRRPSLIKSSTSLKTITQKKLIGALPKKMEKSINTEVTNLKYIEPKVDTNRRQISRVNTQLVAAVTQRLYAKPNKKDSGMGTNGSLNSITSEVPKELTISKNARFRLKELTQRALKSHKNKNIDTQTDLYPVLWVKEVGTDTIDLKKKLSEVKDFGVLNTPETLDAEVECTLLNNFIKRDIKNILVVTRSCGVQTTDYIHPVSFKRYLTETNHGKQIIAESLNINILHNYINGAKNDSLSDDSLDNGLHNVKFPTPDLISAHNSLEQHAQSSRENDYKLKFAVNNVIEQCFEETILRLHLEEVGMARLLRIKNEDTRIKNIEAICAHASQIVMPDIFKEKCKALLNFTILGLVSPRLIEYRERNLCEPLIIRQPVFKRVILRSITESYANSEHAESLADKDQFSDVADSIDPHTANRRKVQLREKSHQSHKNEKLVQVMTDFVAEATTLMKNLTKTATKIEQNLHKNCLEDCELQITVNDVFSVDNFKRKEKKSPNNGTQPKLKSSISQTSGDMVDFMTPTNKHETLLEDSCKRLEHKIKTICPSTRQVSAVSQESDDDFIFHTLSRGNRFSVTRYNSWNLSNFKMEDSSLESNPVIFSDNGSLPRKTYKRQRTPTCSPSAFLKQLTNMRKQVIETSRVAKK